MKMLLVTDTHLGLYNDSDIWLDVTKNLFQSVIDACITNNISTVVHLGDFFHNHKTTNTKTLAFAKNIAEMFEIEKIMVHMIVGNHDCYYKNEIQPNSLSIFKKYLHINVIEEPYLLENIALIPWSFYPEMDAKYCMGHFAISGFLMNDAFTCKVGHDHRSFKKFDKVFSGHFHKASTGHNITYLGNPFQQDFHDSELQKGYYIFDNETSELDFIEFTNYPKFVTIKIEDYKNTDVTGNIINILFEKDYGTNKNNKLIDDVYRLEPLKIKSTRILNVEEESPIKEEDDGEILLDNKKLMMEFIDKSENLPKNIKKKVLKSMFNTIVNNLGE